MKTITLNVCQGVGDIFWVYQKFAPHVDQINFCISMVPGGTAKVQTRAVEFLKLLPKTNKVTTKVVTDNDYFKLAHGDFSLPDILAKFEQGERGSFDYGCNNLLEQGVRLEAIDPNFAIEETVAMRSEPIDLNFQPGDYVTVYISGSTADTGAAQFHKLWTVNQWHEFVTLFYQKYQLTYPIVLIGASYDQGPSSELEEKLKASGHQTQLVIDSSPAQVVHILKGTVCFINYQSGLSILADNLDVAQVMMYFPMLEKMQYAWCKRKNIENGAFNANLFNRTPQEVVDGLKLDFQSRRPMVGHNLDTVETAVRSCSGLLL